VSTQSLQIVPKEREAGELSAGWSPRAVLLVQWASGTILVFVLGTWLVWLAVYLERHFAEQDIRLACKRVMPETAERCFDTVIIQRGGARR
jgi:hypothetical protein